jgi:hypothetical protein
MVVGLKSKIIHHWAYPKNGKGKGKEIPLEALRVPAG